MINTTQDREPLKSIWGITPEIALREALSIIDESEMSQFYGKTLLDVGAGFSNLLDYVAAHSEPNRMIAIDPIYGWDEPKAAIYTINAIHSFVEELLKASDGIDDEYLLNMKHNAERQKETILNYHNQDSTIERYKEIPDGVNADYAFAINVLFWVDNPREILVKMDQSLAPDGIITIIDYVWRGNKIDQKLQQAGISIRKFEQYFVARLRKWEANKIDWSKK